MTEPRELILLSKAERMLAQADTVDEVKDLLDKASVVRAYAKKAKLGQKLVIDAAVIRLRAERRLGEILSSLELAHAVPGNQYTGPQPPPVAGQSSLYLRDLGITKSDSSRSQRIARLPDELFERYLAENVQVEREPTVAGLMRLVKATVSPAGDEPQPIHSSERPSPLAPITGNGWKFPTIYADPPWTAEDADTGGPNRIADRIAAEPVAAVCEAEAHLHLWVTTATLPYGFQIIKAWGFAYRSCLVCLDAAIRGTMYWHDAQQFLLLGVRGELPFSGPEQPGWTKFDWPEDGSKPDAVRELIEAVSPGPYLDMYGTLRHPTEAWVSLPSPFAPEINESVDHTEFHTESSTDA